MTMTPLLPSSATATAALAAINSIGAATAGSVNAQETDVKKGKQLLHHDGIKQDQTTADLTNSAPSIAIKKQSTAVMKPDVGILSKDFMKNKGKERSIANSAQSSIVKKKSIVKIKPDIGVLSKDFLKNKGYEQPVDKQFTIHRKKRASAADVDVGILDQRRHGGGQWRQQKASQVNLHAMNEVTGRSLQIEERPLMCPAKYGGGSFNQTDGYFPKCSCPSPTTCGPKLCECLELDADGDIYQCMDPLKQLCEGTKYIEGIPGPWSMEECLGGGLDGKILAMTYCSLPCIVDGGSVRQCSCNFYDSYCTATRHPKVCAMSKCCQAQTDDEGREACLYGGLHQNYYDEDTSFSLSPQEMASRFKECAFNSEGDKSIVQCYCDSFSYGFCVNYGVVYPDACEAMNCCWEQTEDDARLDCFSRFRTDLTGYGFYHYLDTSYESCVASGKSSDQCGCHILGLTYCFVASDTEPRCDLFQCCQSETGDEGRGDCILRHQIQSLYETCVDDGKTTESCYCDRSNTLCSSGHSNDRHCELSSCCQEQADDAGRKECIGNFTTSQTSFAPSETTPAEDTGDDGVSPTPTAASALPGTGTSSASIPTPFGAKSPSKTTSKMLAVTAAVIGWLLLS